MTENQSEATEAPPSGEPAEPAPKPELMGYKSVEELVAAKVSSDAHAKQLAAEHAELKARLESMERSQPPAGPPPAQDDAYWEEVEAYAAKGDPVAKGLVMQRQRDEQLTQALAASFELLDIEDKSERLAVRKHLLSNPGRNLDVRGALSEVRAKTLADSKSKLEQELADTRAKLEALSKKPPMDVVRTEGREITATQLKGEMIAESEFDRRVEALRAEGDHKGAMRLQQQSRNGEIKIKFGQ